MFWFDIVNKKYFKALVGAPPRVSINMYMLHVLDFYVLSTLLTLPLWMKCILLGSSAFSLLKSATSHLCSGLSHSIDPMNIESLLREIQTCISYCSWYYVLAKRSDEATELVKVILWFTSSPLSDSAQCTPPPAVLFPILHSSILGFSPIVWNTSLTFSLSTSLSSTARPTTSCFCFDPLLQRLS